MLAAMRADAADTSGSMGVPIFGLFPVGISRLGHFQRAFSRKEQYPLIPEVACSWGRNGASMGNLSGYKYSIPW